MEKFYRGVFHPLPKQHICKEMYILHKYANGMIGLGGEHSPTAQNMKLP